MSEIDVQNAKQIRDPMTVLITMEVLDDEVTLTYSGYSSAKVADGVLKQSTWPMRKLADLQGDGFPLDGSCALYNANTSPSQANGKLGVRSNVGQAVSVTVTGDETIAGIFVYVTGAESVTYNGTTDAIYNNTVTIPVNAAFISLTFNPATETERIEISEISPGASFNITNENLIRAAVSLRSDLSIIDPALPESEINIEAYQNTDISEVVAAIPEDTPITYSAGYEGDMSPERKFYVTGQVTWADNVLTIQGVDAVHLIKPLPETIMLPVFNKWERLNPQDPGSVGFFVRHLLSFSGVSFIDTLDGGGFYDCEEESTSNAPLYDAKTEGREIIAEMMNLFHLHIPEYSTKEWYRPVYVDAGRPSLTTLNAVVKWSIREDDCADLVRIVEPKLSRVVYAGEDTYLNGPTANPEESLFEVGAINITYNEAAFLSIDDDALSWIIGVPEKELWGAENTVLPLVPADTNGREGGMMPWAEENYSPLTGTLLISGETKQKLTNWYRQEGTLYTSIIPWDANFRHVWPGSFTNLWSELQEYGLIDADTKQYEMKLYGTKIVREPIEIEAAADGGAVTYNLSTALKGALWGATRSQGPAIKRLFPEVCIESLFDRSNVTGSFTWKGDPRMQPRDVVEFVRLDGTVQEITLENITITHEAGGTYAEITYREGVV